MIFDQRIVAVEASDNALFPVFLMDFQTSKCYTKFMSERGETPVAGHIRKMAQQHNIAYVRWPRDALAHHITRLAGDDVEFDDIEQLLVALQRSGHLSRAEMVQLQAAYLRETRL